MCNKCCGLTDRPSDGITQACWMLRKERNMNFLKSSLYGSVVFAALANAAFAADTIKVGVLHSLSGTMAISETTLKDTMLM